MMIYLPSARHSFALWLGLVVSTAIVACTRQRPMRAKLCLKARMMSSLFLIQPSINNRLSHLKPNGSVHGNGLVQTGGPTRLTTGRSETARSWVLQRLSVHSVCFPLKSTTKVILFKCRSMYSCSETTKHPCQRHWGLVSDLEDKAKSMTSDMPWFIQPNGSTP